MLQSLFTHCSCCFEKTYICPLVRRVFSLPLSPFLWPELKSMITQLRNVHLSSKVHWKEGIKHIPNTKFNNSNNHVECWVQYYQNQARHYVSVGLFLLRSNFQYWQRPSTITQLSGRSVLTLCRGSRVNRSKVIGPLKQFKDRNICLEWESAVSRGSITDN